MSYHYFFLIFYSCTLHVCPFPEMGLGDLSLTKMFPEVTEITISGMVQPVILTYMKFSEAEQGQNTQTQNTQAQNTQD